MQLIATGLISRDEHAIENIKEDVTEDSGTKYFVDILSHLSSVSSIPLVYRMSIYSEAIQDLLLDLYLGRIMDDIYKEMAKLINTNLVGHPQITTSELPSLLAVEAVKMFGSSQLMKYTAAQLETLERMKLQVPITYALISTLRLVPEFDLRYLLSIRTLKELRNTAALPELARGQWLPIISAFESRNSDFAKELQDLHAAVRALGFA